jgi:hypothetical protein
MGAVAPTKPCKLIAKATGCGAFFRANSLTFAAPRMTIPKRIALRLINPDPGGAVVKSPTSLCSVLMVLSIPALASAQEEATKIDPAVIDAWEKAGGFFGWTYEHIFMVGNPKQPAPPPFNRPAFRFAKYEGKVISKLPG